MNDMEMALIKKAINGDLDAFEKVIRTYEKLIYNVAYRMLLNREDAKDVSQEIIIKIYRNMDKCKEPEAFKSWMYRIIKNACMDELRKRKGKYTESLNEDIGWEDGEVSKQTASLDKGPEEEVLSKETTFEVRQAVEKLPEKYRILIILRDLNGLSYGEIAEITETNLGTVKSRISRARNALKIIISENGNKLYEDTSNKYDSMKGGRYNG